MKLKGTTPRNPRPRPNETNEQFVLRLMRFSDHGALMQAFILEALRRYAEQCVKAGPEVFESPLLSGKAWHGTAQEALKELEARHGK